MVRAAAGKISSVSGTAGRGVKRGPRLRGLSSLSAASPRCAAAASSSDFTRGREPNLSLSCCSLGAVVVTVMENLPGLSGVGEGKEDGVEEGKDLGEVGEGKDLGEVGDGKGWLGEG